MTTSCTNTNGVYAAINAVQSALAKTGIAKSRQTTGGGTYMFRGIDDVYAALAPLLAEHRLCVIPRCVNRSVVERSTKSGGALFVVCVEAEFDFVSANDGSKHTARTFGEASDSGDKATNKAMSAAYKYAAFQTFCIPTEGDNDADSVNHEISHKAVDEHIAAIVNAATRELLSRAYKAAIAYAKDNQNEPLCARFKAVMEAQAPKFTTKEPA